MRAFWAVVGALCASCASRPDLAELDRGERALEARTVVLERDYTLWSPFTLAQTREWVDLVDEELAASRALLSPSNSLRPFLVLVPIEGFGPQFEDMGNEMRLTPPAGHPLHGIEGTANDDQILVYVTPDRVLQEDSRPVVSHRAAGNYRSTLRHELAHVHAFAAGLDGEDWFCEGLADLVGSYELVEGTLVDCGPQSRDVQRARDLPTESWSVARLLDWREEFGRVVSGAEPVDQVSRSLCGLFMRFLVERAPGSTLVERLRSIDELSRAELQSLDPQWRAWLTEAISHVEGSLPGSATGAASKETQVGATLVEAALNQEPIDACERVLVLSKWIGPRKSGSR